MYLIWTACAAFGFALVYAFYHWKTYHRLKDILTKKIQAAGVFQVKEDELWIRLYRAFSWRNESRLIGKLAKANIPIPFRNLVYKAYIRYYDVRMTDVEEQDLSKYPSLNEFFSRPLKDASRPIADVCLVSPADCYIYHYGKVEDYLVKEIKGIDYHLIAFFGGDIVDQVDLRLRNNKTCLWYCVGYLSPADYHRFHSPADWTVKFRRHFNGRLLSVNENMLHIVRDLFDINERVLTTGEWEYGFFSFTAVGATHVGAIELDFDDHPTNCTNECIGCYDDRIYDPVIRKYKGEPFGRFHFGSALVLVFQAPSSFEFLVTKGQKTNYGQAIARVVN